MSRKFTVIKKRPDLEIHEYVNQENLLQIKIGRNTNDFPKNKVVELLSRIDCINYLGQVNLNKLEAKLLDFINGLVEIEAETIKTK